MSNHRISIVMDEENHKYLKVCCAKLGVTIKDFVSNCINDKIEQFEDEWLFKDSFKDNDGENYTLVDNQGILHAI